MTDIANRTAFITGGANGIGLGIARAFAKEGVKLALADRDEAALAAAKAELSKVVPTETVVLDVRDRETYAREADRIEAALGPVSLLFNNAGVAGGGAATRMTYEMWDWGVGINLTGVINGIQTFLPRMADRGQGGHIVNTASGAGLVHSGSGVLYHTAKYGVVGMSEALNAELQSHHIGVSVLCPGPVATKIVDNTLSHQPGMDAMPEAQKAAIQQLLAPTKKFLDEGVSPDAVGDMVLAAVKANQLFIHTDRLVAPMIEARTKALMAAFPPL